MSNTTARSAELDIEDPRCLVGFSKRILLFQSVRQVLYTVLIVIILNLITYSIIILPFRNVAAYVGATFGLVIALASYLWRVFPHELTISDPRFVLHPEKVEAIISRIFREESRSSTTITYKEKIHPALTWNEATVVLMRSPHSLRVVGPEISLKWLRKRLLKFSMQDSNGKTGSE